MCFNGCSAAQTSDWSWKYLASVPSNAQSVPIATQAFTTKFYVILIVTVITYK